MPAVAGTITVCQYVHMTCPDQHLAEIGMLTVSQECLLLQGQSLSASHLLLTRFPGPLMPNTPKEKVRPARLYAWSAMCHQYEQQVFAAC